MAFEAARRSDACDPLGWRTYAYANAGDYVKWFVERILVLVPDQAIVPYY